MLLHLPHRFPSRTAASGSLPTQSRPARIIVIIVIIINSTTTTIIIIIRSVPNLPDPSQSPPPPPSWLPRGGIGSAAPSAMPRFKILLCRLQTEGSAS